MACHSGTHSNVGSAHPPGCRTFAANLSLIQKKEFTHSRKPQQADNPTDSHLDFDPWIDFRIRRIRNSHLCLYLVKSEQLKWEQKSGCDSILQKVLVAAACAGWHNAAQWHNWHMPEQSAHSPAASGEFHSHKIH